jgi:hypothetical protein
VKSQLAKAVSAGTISQAQSDTLYAMLQRAVAVGHYPGLVRSGFGAGVGADVNL